MNIIFGEEAATRLSERYTVLELDTFLFKGSDEPAVAYTVIEEITLDDLPNVENNKILHAELVSALKSQEWSRCAELAQSLKGAWNSEIDSYYEDIEARVNKLAIECPSDWSYIIDKTK